MGIVSSRWGLSTLWLLLISAEAGFDIMAVASETEGGASAP